VQSPSGSLCQRVTPMISRDRWSVVLTASLFENLKAGFRANGRVPSAPPLRAER